MPLALKCTCGRSLRVKDELAGKKVRCPSCSAILTAPKPDAEEEAVTLLLAEDEAPAKSQDSADNLPTTDAVQPPPRPGPRPRSPSSPPSPEWKSLKKKPDRDLSVVRKRKRRSSGGFFNNVNPNYGVMWSGALMVLGSFLLCLVNVGVFIAGWIIFYLLAITIVLFFAGMGTFFKGLMGRSE
jgi:hypothetical protein